MRKFLQTVPVEEFKNFVLSLQPLGKERIALSDCLGRVLAEDVAADEDIPSFRRATMDGYAVRAQDTAGASASAPAYLAQAGEVAMGRPPDEDVRPGACAGIFTGGMMPASADAVVMVEYCRELPGGLVEISAPVAPGENVSQAGEDINAGRAVARRGAVIRPQEVAGFAAVGAVSIAVFRRVRVGIISTGDELVEPAARPGPGQVRNVNQHSLMAQVLAGGAVPALFGICQDDPAVIEARVRQALTVSDVVLISGGSSVGNHDRTAEIIQKLGPPGLVFHGVSIRPGKPTILGRSGDKLVFGLPGHPVSAMVSCLNFVAPALSALSGAGPTVEYAVPAKLADNIHSKAGRQDHVQVRLEIEGSGLLAVPIFKKSGMVSAMAAADGYLTVPAEREGVEIGETVAVHPYPRTFR